MIKTKFPSSINSKEYNKLNNELGKKKKRMGGGGGGNYNYIKAK